MLAAHEARVSKHRIHLLTGLARTTIDRIVAQDRPPAETDILDIATGG